MAYQSYRDLDIHKKAHKLAIEVHQMTLKLPKFEMYEEGSQIRKSSKSVKNNVVEGFGRMINNFIKSVESNHKTGIKHPASRIDNE